MVFVTGATGLVGRYLVCELLKHGDEVRALCRPSSNRQAVIDHAERQGIGTERLHWFEGELEDGMCLEEAMQGCERVYHCAAVVSFHRKDAQKMRQVNRDATATLVNAMLHAGVPELVHISSVAALGRKGDDPVHEDVPFEYGPDATAYACSKFEAELEVWRGQEEGLKVLTVNPSIIIGSGDFSKSSSMLFTLVHKGLAWYPTGSNGFVSAGDVAKAARLLAEYRCWGERYILNAENETYQRLMEMMAQGLNTKAPTWPLRPIFMALAWRLGMVWEWISRRRFPISKESVANTHSHHRYASTKLQDALLAKGVIWTYESIQNVVRQGANDFLRMKETN